MKIDYNDLYEDVNKFKNDFSKICNNAGYKDIHYEYRFIFIDNEIEELLDIYLNKKHLIELLFANIAGDETLAQKVFNRLVDNEEL